MTNECIIIGGGRSLEPHLSELQPLLATKFTILTNYSFKHFLGTFLAFTDRDFYYPKPDAKNPNIYEELKKLPLIIGVNQNGVEEFKLSNTILFPRNKFYMGALTGIFALSLASYLIDSGIIYLLGFDWTRQPIPKNKSLYNPNQGGYIHYYKNEIIHRGNGYTGYYDNHNPDKEFKSFLNNKNIKIYNVSPNSNINTFDKISYEQFFGLISKKQENQDELRIKIKEKLKCIL